MGLVDKSIELGTIDEEPILKEAPAPDSPPFTLPNIAEQIMTEVAEEDKDSGFGDYGDSSDDDD